MIAASDRPLCPLEVDLTGRLVVVIGGGSVAEGALRSLAPYKPDVLVVAPLVTPGIDELVAQGLIEHEQRSYVRGDLAGASLAISATDSIEVDRAVYQEAEGMGCFVFVESSPDLSSFTFNFPAE